MDVLELSRIQFAANITFHFLFPSITIALGWFLLFFKLRFNFTKDVKWMDIYFFWTKVFALCFAIGVVTGITMSFQFGTNWPGFMNTVGNVAGPLLGYEVLTAFFLEASFLGVMLFGYKRVKPWVHTLATFLVAFGTLLSAFWILVLNSWMQTPQGIVMIGGEAIVTSWFEVIFNPSMPYRLIHTLLASVLTASFLIIGLSAYRVLKNGNTKILRSTMQAAIIVAAIVTPTQIFIGDLHGLNTYKHQPQKVAAIEGLWQTQKGAPFVLFGIPDEKQKKNLMSLEIPKMGSYILTHDFNGEVKGLDQFEDKHPPVGKVFYSFRIMVLFGILMLIFSWLGVFYIIKNREFPKYYLKILFFMTFSGWIPTIAGWYVTEIGRQPYLVQGILKTADAVTTAVQSSYVGITLTIYLIVYAVLFYAFISTIFYLARGASDKLSNKHKEIDLGDRRSAAVKIST